MKFNQNLNAKCWAPAPVTLPDDLLVLLTDYKPSLSTTISCMSTETWTNKTQYYHSISPSPPFLLTDPDVTYADAVKGKRAPLYKYIKEEQEHAQTHLFFYTCPFCKYHYTYLWGLSRLEVCAESCGLLVHILFHFAILYIYIYYYLLLFVLSCISTQP
jgi:hypothetical protein